ncbi:MAG: M60 family metallopeptidase [Bacteroidaceae bacterium]|nr:M60 family metallopeptidase [Bacteroidaceae bacterium]
MKRLLNLLTALLLTLVGTESMAASQTITIGTSTGTFYRNGSTELTLSSSSQYANKWMSTSADPQVTLSCSNNNMIVTSSQFSIHTDNYTIAVEGNYQITGYTIKAYTNSSTASTITPSGGSAQTISTNSSSPTTVAVSGLSTSSATFAVSTDSPWIVITSFTVTVEQVSYVSSITSGKTYRLHSYYSDLSMEATGNKLSSVTTNAGSYAQMWKITKSGSYYTFQNVLTEEYIQPNSSTSGQWTLGSNKCNFSVSSKTTDGTTWFSFSNASSSWYGLHTAASQSYYVVGWNYEADASYWQLEEVTLTSAQEAELAEIKAVTSADHTSALSTFFSDKACTTLKSTYASMTDAQLRSAMSSLPAALQEMAVRVKNDTWNSDATWNAYEKDFRIHEYEIYSNCELWYSKLKIGRFARLSNPTGIQAKTGDMLYLFVDSDVKDSNATLEAELVIGANRTGATTTLQQGYNAIYVTADCEIFITYLLNNTDESCNNYPDIKVHIEGGTCNGCFDMHRGHTNDDWAWLKSNMFKGTYLHVKGNSVMLNVYLNSVKGESNATGVMKIWDFIFDTEQSLTGCDQYKSTGQYKMMVNPFDNGTVGTNPFWSDGNHGSSHPGITTGDTFNYSNLSNIGTNGGAIWVIEHELGHGHQGPINIAGQTESSNNSLAQAVNLLAKDSELFQSTRSSRGEGVKAMISRFNQDGGYSWIDYGGMRTQSGDYSDVWISNKMYFQLWLYFDYLGNYQPSGGNTGFSFMSALYSKLRSSGLSKSTNSSSPANATQDYLKIAQYAAEITQTDLSEFFEAWGFWKTSPAVSNDKDIPESGIYAFPDYSTYYIKVTDAMVNSVRSAMQQYTKKGGNIMFIEDRGVGSTLATYNGAATSTFGEVGYYETYANKVVSPYDYTLSGTKVTMTGGKGAVGFKIYDADGNLVYIANTNSFTVSSTIAAGLKNGTYTLKAAQGDGKDYAMGECYDADADTPITDFTEVSNYKYYTIRTAARGWLCVPEGSTQLRPTALAGLTPDESDPQQQFALVEKNGKNYLYNVGEGKFVGDSGPTTTLVTPGVRHEITLLSTDVEDYPTAIKFVGTGDQINVSTAGNPGVVTNWNYITDSGNQLAIMPAGTFDPSEALSWLPITSTDEISNARAYTIFCDRGTLGVSDNQLVSTSISSFTASDFALISYESQFYLWSIEAGKFVNATGDVTNIEPTPITLKDLGSGLFQLQYGSNVINTSSGYAPGLVINGWSTLDAGNQYTIAPVGDFDPTEALTVLGAPVPTDYTYVTDLADLSNEKIYIITNSRGTWSATSESLTTKGVVDTEMESEHFAILKSEDRYYLYSIHTGKFLTPDNTLSDEPRHIEISASGDEAYPWFFRFDETHNINVNTVGTILIDSYSTLDEGNRNAIIELGDFDPSAAMDRTPTVEAYLLPWFTTNVDQYFGLKKSVCDEHYDACQALATACSPYAYEEMRSIVGANVIWPETGQYRIKSSGSRIGESYIGYGTSSVYNTTGLVTVPASDVEDDPTTVLTLTRVEGKEATYTISMTEGNVQAFTDFSSTTLNTAYSVSADEGAEFLFDICTPGMVNISTARGYTYFHEAGYDSAAPPVVRWDNQGEASRWSVVDIVTTLPGDVNRDGSITIADVTALVNIILGKDTTGQYDHEAADVNGDQSITIADVTALVNIILGKN